MATNTQIELKMKQVYHLTEGIIFHPAIFSGVRDNNLTFIFMAGDCPIEASLARDCVQMLGRYLFVIQEGIMRQRGIHYSQNLEDNPLVKAEGMDRTLGALEALAN